MIKKLFGSLREYKTPTLLTLFAMVFEVFFEVLIPFYTADLVNGIKAGVQMSTVGKTGLILLLMAPRARFSAQEPRRALQKI